MATPLAHGRDAARLYIPDRVDTFGLLGTTLYWATGCGREFSPARTRVRSVSSRQPAPIEADRLSADTQTLFNPAGCPESRVVPDAMAAFGEFVYWITGDGRVVRLERSAAAGATPRTLGRTDARSFGPDAELQIAVDDDFVYWSEPGGVFRMPATGGAHTRIYRTPGTIVQLAAGGDRTVYLLDGRRTGRLFVALDPQPGGTYEIVDLVGTAATTAFALDATRVYWASVTDGRYAIRSRSRTSSGTSRWGATTTHFSSPSTARRIRTIDNIAVDAAQIYWHVVADVSGGPVVRFDRASRVVTPITDWRLMGRPLLSDGQSLD
jgi:hypothetical protein